MPALSPPQQHAPALLRAWARVRVALPLVGVLAFLVLPGLPRDDRRALERELRTGTFHLTVTEGVRALRAYLANADDMYHFHAYAQATLGRPYRSYFIRSRAEWEAAFATGVQQDPDARPVVTPSAPLRPYRDFLVEYPPGFFAVLLAPALLAHTPDGYALAFKLQSALYLLLAFAFVMGLLRELGVADDVRAKMPRVFAVAVFALGVVTTHRFDACVAACIAGSVYAAARGHAGRAGLALGLGVAAKGVPLLLAPLLLAHLSFSNGGIRAASRALLALVASAGGIFLLGWWWGGAGLVNALAYHLDRPVHIESTAGAVLALANALHHGLVAVVYTYSSRNLRGGPVELAGALTGALTLVALAVTLALALIRMRRAADERTRLATLIDGSVALLAIYVTLGRVFCPQYLVWPLPLALVAALAPGRSSRRLHTGLALLVATHLIYPIGYSFVKALVPWASALVLVRNLGVLAWALSLLPWPLPKRAQQPASPIPLDGEAVVGG
jgi:hypothetical protein